MPTKMFYGGTFLTDEDLKEAYKNSNINLEYYKIKLDENVNLNENINQYGIEIVKKENNVVEERKEVLNVTNDEKELNQLLEVLKKNKVTPVSLENILEDLNKKY